MECTKNIINDGSDFHWTQIETRVRYHQSGRVAFAKEYNNNTGKKSVKRLVSSSIGS